jgi:hypothetical protein
VADGGGVDVATDELPTLSSADGRADEIKWVHNVTFGQLRLRRRVTPLVE